MGDSRPVHDARAAGDGAVPDPAGGVSSTASAGQSGGGSAGAARALGSDDYSADYYRMSRSEAGTKGLVDRVRDAYIRRLILRRVPGGRLLDVGCGLGLFLERMAADFELYGIDISEYGIAEAAIRLPDARLAVGSLTEPLPFDVTFDVVTAINIVEHLADPAAGLDAVRARLRPGGLFVAHLPTIGNAVQARLYAGSYAKDPTHIYRPSGAEFCRLAERHGFVTSTSSYAPFVGAPVWRRLPWHPAFLAVFRAV
jgi:SAM-dependent methyltransferase